MGSFRLFYERYHGYHDVAGMKSKHLTRRVTLLHYSSNLNVQYRPRSTDDAIAPKDLSPSPPPPLPQTTPDTHPS